jgi:hypothetical protein
MVCIAAQMEAQTLKEQPPKKQDTVQQASAAEQAPAAQSAKNDFPLDAFRDFSAIMVGSRAGFGESGQESHIYRSGDLMRVEGTEHRGYFITNLKTLETYGMTEAPCAFSKHPYMGTTPFPAHKVDTTVERVPVGKETFDGHSCQIEEVTVSSKAPGQNPLKMKLWEADDLQGFPIKIEYPYPGGKTAVVLYKNVVLGPQDPTLFIHPKSCESLESLNQKKSPKSIAPTKKPPADGAKN